VRKGKKEGDWYVYPYFIALKTLTFLITYINVIKSSDPDYSIPLAQGKRL